MNRKIVLLVLIPVMLFSIVLGARPIERRVDVANSGDSGLEVLSGSGESGNVDWWPMFHHDLSLTGYSTSKAPKTNDTLWSSTIGGDRVYSPSVADGRVYMGDKNGLLYCLNASTGEQIWCSGTLPPHAVTGSGCAAVADGKVYWGGITDMCFYCLNASTGEAIWNYTLWMAQFFSSPTVSDGRVYIGTSGLGHQFSCLNASTGEQIWYCYVSTCSSSAVVNGKVYLHNGNEVDCLNGTTGERIWWQPIGGGSSDFESSPAVVDDRVYVGGWNGVYCFNASTGEQLWMSIPTSADIESSPAFADGKVYVGSDNNVYCLDASTGLQLWSYTTGNSLQACSPAVASGKVYITSSDCKLYCLNASTGNFIWAYKIGDTWHYDSRNLSPAVANGKLYSGSMNGKLYCFGGHDVAVVDASPSSTEAYTGQTVNVTVTVRNEGTFNETFDVSAYHDSVEIGVQTVTDLAQDTEATLTFGWNTTGIAGGYYTLSANSSIIPEETNTTNNVFIDGTVKITSPVRIAEVIPCNQTGYPKDTFKLGTLAFFKVTINSTALILQNTLITINLYDNASATISLESFQALITPGTSTIIFGLSIPATATLGTATVYACAYTDWPSQGGFPHCPEVSATLEIAGP